MAPKILPKHNKQNKIEHYAQKVQIWKDFT